MSATVLVQCPNDHCRLQLRVPPAAMGVCPACGVALAMPMGASGGRLDPDATPMPDAYPSLAALQAALKPPPSGASTIGEPRPASTFPRALGRFELRRFLAEGSFGRVYEAYDPQLDRMVALKVAKVEQMDTAERVQRFLREARAAANLRHPNIVPVFDAGRQGDYFYIATAIITGRTLAETMQRERLSIRRAAEIACALAEALGYAHRRGVVHRDVKPANVMMDEADEPVLTDFGLAFRQEEERLTRDGALLGTPQYMAPEQARGQQGSALPASDQYSLGAMLFEMLTGRPLFEGTPQSVLFHHVQSQPQKPASLNPSVPAVLEDICLRCLRKEPADRFGDCTQLAQALRQWLEGHLHTALPRKRRRKGRESYPLPSRPKGWCRSMGLFLETGLWQIATITSIFAAGLAVACWLKR